MIRRVAALALALSVAGCDAAAPPPPPRVPEKPPAGAPASDLSGPWGDVRSQRFDLGISLPDGAGWAVDDRSGTWLEARHAASSSTLLVRVWREDENMNRDRCEAKARALRNLPSREGADLVRRERVAVPPEFDTTVDVGVVATDPSSPIAGFAIAFGGWAHRCFAFVYLTSASGKGAERLLGMRLAAMVDGTLANLEHRSDLAPRIPREPVGPRR